MSWDDNYRQPSTPLTPVERQTLLMLHQVLSHLDSEGAADHERAVEVLRRDFSFDYGGLYRPEPKLPHADRRLLNDILNMFNQLKTSLGYLPKEERDALVSDGRYVVTFQGFASDVVREGAMANYLRYLMETGQWNGLSKNITAANVGKSITPRLDLYEAMLAVYRPTYAEVVREDAGGFQLNGEQIRRVGAVRP